MARPLVVRIRTRRDAQRRILVLVAGLGSVQFLPNALSVLLPGMAMVVLWLAAAFFAGVGSIVFEMYKSKHARW